MKQYEKILIALRCPMYGAEIARLLGRAKVNSELARLEKRGLITRAKKERLKKGRTRQYWRLTKAGRNYVKNIKDELHNA